MADPGDALIDAARAVADLRELANRTGDDSGAQRLCWTEGWGDARAFLIELVDEIGVGHELDRAGNLWATLDSGSRPALALGSHLDSVPDGGWLDGALGVMAALGVLRAWAESSSKPSRPIALVDWADEEGARFGRSLFGSSAFAGSLDPAAVANARDADGERLEEVLAANAVRLDRVLEAGARRDRIGQYLELHIEQGPVLEAEGLGAAAVEGCVGIERHRLRFRGQASHAGTTPMSHRRDAGLAAAQAALRIEAIARERSGVATTGSLALRPGIATAVPGEAELLVDLRHGDSRALVEMLSAVVAEARTIAASRDCGLEIEPVWAIDPTRFDRALVDAAAEVVEERTDSTRRMVSGALHDAAEVARVLPAAMVFVPSVAGISHAKEEDTSDEDLIAGIEAFGALANRVLARPGS